MTVFISGGCKNGKSTYAENIAAFLSRDAKHLYYIATMLPVDEEDEARIIRHRQSREGLGFETVERGRDISGIAGLCNAQGTFLLDSVTALLANEMFSGNSAINRSAHIKVADGLAAALRCAANMVIVSDYIYSDACLYDEYTEAYRKGLAFIDRQCAAICDVVIEVSFSSIIFHKGKSLLEGLHETVA